MENKRVLVAMSGGVDSSVSALLLKEAGYEVIGVTLSIWEEVPSIYDKSYRGCCSLEAVNDAKKVAHQLGISHYTLNFKEEFKKSVIDYFAQEYLAGRTPNPCLKCNQIIKFDLLLKKALSLSVRYLATGHYAKVEFDKKRKAYLIKEGKDTRKDQSYVLYMLNQKNLPHILFPLGDLEKGEVRKIAERNGLHIALKRESQEICFIQEEHYGEFLQKYFPKVSKPGSIVNKQGEMLGKHRGVIFYTIGQRKGLGISSTKPLYVAAINPLRNTLTVGQERELFQKEFIAKEANWVFWNEPPAEFRAQAKIRYKSKKVPATIKVLKEDEFEVTFDTPQKAIAPGQAAVLYDEEIVLGGGIIEKAI